MKKIVCAATVILFFGIFIGCKKDNYLISTVVRDCTGTYLRWGEKDYHVCNTEAVKPYANGTKVKALFFQIKECKGSAVENPVCDMYHPNEGWIEVIGIK